MNATRRLIERQNFCIGMFLNLQADLNNIDCIMIFGSDLHKFLDVEKLKGTRREWFCQDLKRWFPYQKYYPSKKSSSSMLSLDLSRIPIGPQQEIFDGSSPNVMYYDEMPCGEIYNFNQILEVLSRYNRL